MTCCISYQDLLLHHITLQIKLRLWSSDASSTRRTHKSSNFMCIPNHQNTKFNSAIILYDIFPPKKGDQPKTKYWQTTKIYNDKCNANASHYLSCSNAMQTQNNMWEVETKEYMGIFAISQLCLCTTIRFALQHLLVWYGLTGKLNPSKFLFVTRTSFTWGLTCVHGNGGPVERIFPVFHMEEIQ